MNLVEIISPDFIFEDDRGLLAQITHESFGQINAVYTRKGSIRGNSHYHKTTKEAFFIISGKVEVSLSKDDRSEKHIFKTGDMFIIHENVRHTFNYKEDTYLVVLYTSCVEKEDGTKDICSD
jgi:quercetin dioxygenase-like cupin family protein